MTLPKLIIFTAPSGAGKTTIVRHLLNKYDCLAFSVSATTRPMRTHEQHGKDYFFISLESFRERIANGEFLEYQEVYENQYYGTLRSEVEQLWANGKHVVFDIDVQGALNLEKAYPDRTLSVFVQPPSPEILFERLKQRRTEDAASLQKRIDKAAHELTFATHFDTILVNDVLIDTLHKADQLIEHYTHCKPQPTTKKIR